MKLTNTMVLALLQKGFGYEAKNVDVEMGTEVPMSALLMDEDVKGTLRMNVKMKVESLDIKITQD